LISLVGACGLPGSGNRLMGHLRGWLTALVGL
jgi:hypothetical protein